MAGNQFGSCFKVTTYGESHGHSIGVIIDGMPSGIPIDMELLQQQLDRRKPGQSHLTTSRNESDQVMITSGIFEGVTTGTPIHALIHNKDARSDDYTLNSIYYRQGHADRTYELKYGIRDYRGGGRASARETASRVIAGYFASCVLKSTGIQIFAFVSSIGPIQLQSEDPIHYSLIDQNVVRCPNADVASQMIHYLEQLIEEKDSCGGTITCHILNTPPGLGEPVFDKLHAILGHGILSINGCKGIEFGSGFHGASLKGSVYHQTDTIESLIKDQDGGLAGGISNGDTITFRAAFKPVSSSAKHARYQDQDAHRTEIPITGRHDPCVLPRAVPIIEAMTAITLCDLYLIQKIHTK